MNDRRCSTLDLTICVICILLTAPAWGAKVIMKDGKIYEGKIIGETDGDVLIRTPAINPRSKLLPANEVLSVIRDPVVKERDPQRYAAIETRLTGNVFSSKGIELEPAAGISLGGALRFHPLVEVGAGMEWLPAVKGELGVTDGTTTRLYEKFFAYSGGFSAKIYPFFRRPWKAEPFVIAGYRWDRLVPKASGDSLRGRGFQAGIGSHWPCADNLFLQASLVYNRTVYDRISYLGREGSFEPEIHAHSYSFSLGLALRL